MTYESEQLIRPLEQVFYQSKAGQLRELGFKGVIPIEIPIDELISLAESRTYRIAEVSPDSLVGLDGTGFYSIDPVDHSGEYVLGINFYTRPNDNGKSVFILDSHFERFKKYFLDQ